MTLPIKISLSPMEARLVDEIPKGDRWQYEPKWDGFRCIAFRDGKKIDLMSKSGQPLGRYFPEIVEALGNLKASKFVLDGEIVVPVGKALSFDDLLQRIHPAASRVKKLSESHPALYVVFDLLADANGKSFVDAELAERREALEAFARKFLAKHQSFRLSPATTKLAQAKKWFKQTGNALDGVIAKRADLPYRAGTRDGMQKIKNIRTADCVVGGFRYGSKDTETLGSLLLGLYDEDGLLHHIGFCSSFSEKERKELTPRIEKLMKPVTKGGGFTGRAPGGKSRWNTERSSEWQPLAPKLVVEVSYDHFTGGRFRHGTSLVRWRPDKKPDACTMEQVKRTSATLSLIADKPARKRAR